MTTTANTNAVTTQDILDIMPNDGELKLIIDNKAFFVVGLDGNKNTVSLDWHQSVVTPDTFEMSLNGYSSIKKIEEGCYELLPSNQGKVVPRRSQSVDDGLELPF